jgi:hypothetical protein
MDELRLKYYKELTDRLPDSLSYTKESDFDGYLVISGFTSNPRFDSISIDCNGGCGDFILQKGGEPAYIWYLSYTDSTQRQFPRISDALAEITRLILNKSEEEEPYRYYL